MLIPARYPPSSARYSAIPRDYRSWLVCSVSRGVDHDNSHCLCRNPVQCHDFLPEEPKLTFYAKWELVGLGMAREFWVVYVGGRNDNPSKLRLVAAVRGSVAKISKVPDVQISCKAANGRLRECLAGY